MRNRVVIGILGISVASPGCSLVSTAVHNVCVEARENWEEHWESRHWHRLEAGAVSESGTMCPQPAIVQTGSASAEVPTPPLHVSSMSPANEPHGKVEELTAILPLAALQSPAIVSEPVQVTAEPAASERPSIRVAEFIAAWFHSLEPNAKERPIADVTAARREMRPVSPYAPFPGAGY